MNLVFLAREILASRKAQPWVVVAMLFLIVLLTGCKFNAKDVNLDVNPIIDAPLPKTSPKQEFQVTSEYEKLIKELW